MKRFLGTLTVGLLLSLVAITVVGGVAFGAIVGSRIQAEDPRMSLSSGISVQDSTDDEGQHIRWAYTGTTSTRASISISPTATVNQVVVRGRQPSTGTAVMALYSDGAKVGTFTPPKGSNMGTVTVTLTSPIAAGTTPTFAIGPNANLANFVIVDWFELHNTGSTGGDTTPPAAPTITGEPAEGGTDSDGNVSFSFTGAESGGTFECSNVLQGQAATYSACPSPKPYSGLANGSYTFSVRQKDAAGNVGAAASRNYSVSTPTGGDTTPPGTSITSADLGTTNDNTPTFTFSGTDDVGVTGFECRVYASGSPAPAFSSCASPYTTATLSEGNYVFEVRAKDAAGNVDATPASDSFTVSGDAPSAAFSFGFRGASFRTETALKDPMFHTQHMHDFFCANNVTDPTDYDRLVRGTTSCKRPEDHSARWMPQLKINGIVQTPKRSGFYYQCMRPFTASQCAKVQPFPAGFRMVAGERPGDFGNVQWHCDIRGQKNAQEDPPTRCSDTDLGIGMIIRFPECWNGWTLDPTTATEPHVVNARYDSNGKYGCPATHPVQLSTLRSFPDYPNAPKTLKTVEVSVGHMAWGPPSSYHANTISAFTGDSMVQLTKDCITDYPLQTSPVAGCDLGV